MLLHLYCSSSPYDVTIQGNVNTPPVLILFPIESIRTASTEIRDNVSIIEINSGCCQCLQKCQSLKCITGGLILGMYITGMILFFVGVALKERSDIAPIMGYSGIGLVTIANVILMIYAYCKQYHPERLDPRLR